MRVYLHIGYGKTGTTSIQDYLFSNRRELSNELFYPEVGLRGSGHHELAPLGDEYISETVRLSLGHLVNQMGAMSVARAVVSSEFLCYAKPGYVKELSDIFNGLDVRVVIYVRNQVGLIQSTYLQWQKEGWDYRGSIEKFFMLHEQSFDFMQRIKPWAEAFGYENVIARVFDKRVVGNDVCADFLKVVGLGEVYCKSAMKHSNESLLPEFSDLIGTLDNMVRSPEERRTIINKLLCISTELRSASRKRLFTQEQTHTIRERFVASNSAFAALFLNKAQSDIFLN